MDKEDFVRPPGVPVEGEHIKYEKQVLESLRRSDQAPGSWVGQVYFNTGVFYIGEGFLQKRRPPLLFGGGTDLVKFLAALANLHQDDLKKGMNSSNLQIDRVQNSQLKELNQFYSPSSSDTFAFSFVFILLLRCTTRFRKRNRHLS